MMPFEMKMIADTQEQEVFQIINCFSEIMTRCENENELIKTYYSTSIYEWHILIPNIWGKNA